MTYEIIIDGKVEISSPELLVVGNRVRTRVFTKRGHMANGHESGITTVGVVDRTEKDGTDVDARIRTDDGRLVGFSCSLIGRSTDRIVQAA